MDATLRAVEEFGMQAVILWPNSDAGTDEVSRSIRKFRESKPKIPCRFVKNLPMKYYIKLMQNCHCLVGNSSSGLREGAFIGTPCIDVGTRQSSRETSKNVIRVDNNSAHILEALKSHPNIGPKKDNLYGTGDSASRIVSILSEINNPNFKAQKRFFETK